MPMLIECSIKHTFLFKHLYLTAVVLARYDNGSTSLSTDEIWKGLATSLSL